MTFSDLYKQLKATDATRINRKSNALMIKKNPDLVPWVMDILFQVDDETSCRAAWVLEYVVKEDLNVLLPYIDRFTKEMNKVHLDSAVRPVAKICEYIIEAYYGKIDHPVKSILNTEHKERIVELCFDYLITDQKVAPKAYSMGILFLLGQEIKWVHPELITILEQHYSTGSAGFKARARHVLKKLKKSA